MSSYRAHTIESAPEGSRAALHTLQQRFGLVPNLAATMAVSPTLLNGFLGALLNFGAGQLTGGERQIVLLTNAVTNQCAWAVAFHSTAALREGVGAAEVEAIRGVHAPGEPRAAALWAITRALVEKRGHLGDADLHAFAHAGFDPDLVFEIIAGIGASLMANYAGNITRPLVEAPFQAQQWGPAR